MDDASPYLYLLLVALLVCSAFFSGTETAFASVNRIRLKSRAADGDKTAAKVLKVAEEYDRALSAILIGNNVVNIAAASIGTVIFSQWFGANGAWISTLVLTVLVLIFGEIIPKSYAKQNADRWALQSVAVLNFLLILLRPLIAFFVMLTNAVARLTKGNSMQPSVTEEELKVLIEESQNEGVLEEQESELVQSALDFDEITADEIITHRVDVCAVDEKEDPEVVKQLFFEKSYSRLPIYSGNIDHIVGIIHSKEFFREYMGHGTVDLSKIIQKTIYVPPKKPISELMRELQKLKSHMAIVTDQYGGTIGIITLEDIIEELVGEIWDESDEEEIEFQKLEAHRYLVSGDLDPEDFFEEIGLNCTSEELEELPNSFAGWALEIFERIPEPGDTYQYRNLEVMVKEIEDQRILKLEVLVHEQELETESE